VYITIQRAPGRSDKRRLTFGQKGQNQIKITTGLRLLKTRHKQKYRKLHII